MFFIFTETGGDNEVWSYGPDVMEAARRLLALRESLRPYIARAMRRYHEEGIPPMRAVAFDFPHDPAADAPDQYLFGDALLIAPVVEAGATRRRVHLPAGDWHHAFTGERHAAGPQDVAAPLGLPPVFVRSGVLPAPLDIPGLRQHPS